MYDARGNVIAGSGFSTTYDALNMAVEHTTGGNPAEYVYGPANERIATRDADGITWTLRDPQERVVREYGEVGEGYELRKDFLHGLGRGFATYDHETAALHFHHVDHLGSVRLVSDAVGAKVSGRAFRPFGEEIPDAGNPNPDGERLKFTGHERDASGLDYMHARYYSSGFGKFLTVDPVLGSVELPQSWNRYAYVRNNPLLLTDPTGEAAFMTSVSMAVSNNPSGLGGAAKIEVGIVIDSEGTVAFFTAAGGGVGLIADVGINVGGSTAATVQDFGGLSLEANGSFKELGGSANASFEFDPDRPFLGFEGGEPVFTGDFGAEAGMGIGLGGGVFIQETEVTPLFRIPVAEAAEGLKSAANELLSFPEKLKALVDRITEPVRRFEGASNDNPCGTSDECKGF